MRAGSLLGSLAAQHAQQGLRPRCWGRLRDLRPAAAEAVQARPVVVRSTLRQPPLRTGWAAGLKPWLPHFAPPRAAASAQERAAALPQVGQPAEHGSTEPTPQKQASPLQKAGHVVLPGRQAQQRSLAAGIARPSARAHQ